MREERIPKKMLHKSGRKTTNRKIQNPIIDQTRKEYRDEREKLRRNIRK